MNRISARPPGRLIEVKEGALRDLRAFRIKGLRLNLKPSKSALKHVGEIGAVGLYRRRLERQRSAVELKGRRRGHVSQPSLRDLGGAAPPPRTRGRTGTSRCAAAGRGVRARYERATALNSTNDVTSCSSQIQVADGFGLNCDPATSTHEDERNLAGVPLIERRRVSGAPGYTVGGSRPIRRHESKSMRVSDCKVVKSTVNRCIA